MMQIPVSPFQDNMVSSPTSVLDVRNRARSPPLPVINKMRRVSRTESRPMPVLDLPPAVSIRSDLDEDVMFQIDYEMDNMMVPSTSGRTDGFESPICGCNDLTAQLRHILTCNAEALTPTTGILGRIVAQTLAIFNLSDDIDLETNEEICPLLVQRLTNAGFQARCVVANGDRGALRLNYLCKLYHIVVEVTLQDVYGNPYCTIIDPTFRHSFEIARAADDYNHLLQLLPPVFIGSRKVLRSMIELMQAAVERSFRSKGMPIPPWRTKKAMISRWAL